MEKFKFLKKNEINKLPLTTGVYCFKEGKKIIYIGKAANIRERVKNHFNQPSYRDGLFIERVKGIGYIKTNSEIEALVLEAKLIKKYKPRYNIVWRDDKNYFFAGRTKENFPRIFITHQIKTQKSKLKSQNYKSKVKTDYVGPFVDGRSLKETLKFLRKVFPYRTCKTLSKHPCLWYQLGRCPAPCISNSKLSQQIPNLEKTMKKESRQNVNNIFKILRGEKQSVLKNLQKEMKSASLADNFERAAKIRDRIGALEKVLANARIFEFQSVLEINWPEIQRKLRKILKIPAGKKISRIEAYDISNIQGKEATGSMIVFIKGVPDKNFYRRFKIRFKKSPNDVAMIKEVLKRRFGHPEWESPGLILIDGGKAQLNVALSVVNRHKSASINVLALAKKRNELYIENRTKPVLLKTLPRDIFNLILQLRDEAHRFAISYHKKLRYRSLIPRFTHN